MDFEVKRLNELEIESDDEWFDVPEHEVDQTETSILQVKYVNVLKEEDIWRLMEDDIQSVSELIFLSKSEATLVLSYFQWDVKRFHEEWFVDEKSIRKSVGILEPPSDDKEGVGQTKDKTLSETEDWETISEEYFFCGVCEESQLLENFASVSCGHLVCICCWKSHINKIINETLPADWFWKLKCPYDSCPASVDRDMIESYASEEEKSKYNRYLLASYVDNKKTMKWCPAECSCAIEAITSSDSGNFDVTCSCLFRFCWHCSKEAHSPVDCGSAAKWFAMNTTTGDNQNSDWILEQTVPCPKCNRRVEENKDFAMLKMTCLPPCNYDFCWHCRGDWTKHGVDMYTCTFGAAPYGDSDDELREMAESADYRYKDCYENWKSNELLMVKAKANLRKLHDVIQYLSNTQLPTEPQLEFIIQAGLQIVESVRVLKWTYPYEYYLPENEVGKKEFLKNLQEDAKTYLKKLYDCIESELPPFLEAEEPSQDFNNFRIKLTGLTSVTRNHYESLVRVLEEGLANVVAHNGEANGSGTNHEDDLVESNC